jgi:hypothetical protein
MLTGSPRCAIASCARPAPGGPANATVVRIALIASAPFAYAIDPAARRLAEVLDAAAALDAPRPSLRLFPLQAPDAAFAAQARLLGVELADAPDPASMAPNHAATRLAGLAETIRNWSPAAVLAIGDSALASGLLALGLASRHAVYGNRLAVELAGTCRLLADQAALADWLRGPSGTAGSARGGAVGVAAR